MRTFRPHFWLVLALAGQLALLVHASRNDSVTVDEFALLPAGLAKIEHGSDVFWLNPVNPPLIPMLQAVPAWLSGERIGRDTIGEERSEARWETGLRFMRERPDRYVGIFAGARSITFLFALGTTVLVFATLRMLTGDDRASTGGAALAAFGPNLVAHGHLATVDAPFTFFVVGTVACLAWIARPRTKTAGTGRASGDRVRAWGDRVRAAAPATLLALSLAGALLAKFTALLLVLLFPVLSLAGGRRRALSTLGAFATALGLALLVVALVFRGEGVGRPMNSFPFASGAFLSLQDGALGHAPSPLPEWYWRGLDRELARVEQKRNVFFFRGQVTREKSPVYFLAALFWKLPVSSLALIAAGIVVLVAAVIRRGGTPGARGNDARHGPFEPFARALLLLLPPVYLLALFSGGVGSNLGVRYVLPVIPFLYMAAATVLSVNRAWIRTLALAGVAASIVATVSNAPHSLAYFNILAGGSGNGWKLLSDSNVDWGQDLPELARLQEERGIPSVALSYFGLADPALYGVRSHPLTTAPQNGNEVIAVSVHHLNGITPFLRVDPALLARLRDQAPFARAGMSILLFDASRYTIRE